MSWLQKCPGSQTFSASVNERFESALHVFSVNHVYQRRVHPSPRLDRIESTNNDLELKVIFFILILDCTMMTCIESAVTEVRNVRSDCDAFDPFHDKVCCRGCLWLAYIRGTWGEFRKEMRTLPKQELSIEI